MVVVLVCPYPPTRALVHDCLVSVSVCTHSPTYTQEDEAKKLAAQAALPPIEEALSHKYSQWDAATGEPTCDNNGQPLDDKVCVWVCTCVYMLSL